MNSTAPALKADPATTRREPDKKQSLQAALDDLVDDYGEKRAKRMIDGLTAADMPSSLAYLAGKPKDNSITALRAALMRAWARLDPDGAWKAALAIANASDRTYALGSVAGELAKTNPDAAMKLAMSMEAPNLRRNVLRALFEDWGRNNITAAVNYWNRHPEIPVDSLTMSSVISSAALKDPATATRVAMTVTSRELSDSAVRWALDKWIQADPAAARNWVDSIADPAQRDRVLSAFVSSDAQSDPRAVIKLAEKIASSDLRSDAVKTIMRNWMGSDPESAIKYVATLDGATTDSSLAWSVGYAMRNLTEQEQQRLLAQLPESKLKASVISNIVRSYASSGRYAQGVAALNLMPESSTRDSSLHGLAVSWAQSEPKALLAWINQQADSSDRDLVVAGYSATLAATDPQAALKWAESIPDKSVQRTTLQNVVVRWMRSNPAAANAWLTATPLLTKTQKDVINRYSRLGSSLPPMTPSVEQKR